MSLFDQLFPEPIALPNPSKVDTARADALDHARRTYFYDHTKFDWVAMARHVPASDRPSIAWLGHVSRVMLDILVNTAQARRAESRTRQGQEGVATAPREFSAELGEGGGIEGALARLVEEFATDDPNVATSLSDFDLAFQRFALPPVAERASSGRRRFEEDESFAWMRLGGANPYMLRRVTELPTEFAVRNQDYLAADLGPRDSLEAALAEGRAFFCDYSVLADAQAGSVPFGPKSVAAPYVLYAVPRGGGRLRPVAIQCRPVPGPLNPVFNPSHGVAWLMAKTAAQAADGNLHQAVMHLARTHLVMEAFYLAMVRCLAQPHPLYHLLHPHFEGTLSINEAAHQALMADGGGVDIVLSGTIGYSRAVTTAAVRAFDFSANALPKELQQRGVLDREVLPDYPFREDGLDVWAAIEAWVSTYVHVFYSDDSSVQGDPELQAFVAEVSDPGKGGIRGVGQAKTRADLVALITQVIFIASAGHAAVNFPQVDMMAYAPNWPLCNVAPPPTATSGATEQDYYRQLPRIGVARLQMALGKLLGGVHHTQLGQYPHHLGADLWLREPRVAEGLSAFQSRLQTIESEIAKRNESRLFSYPYLLPSRIPQSVNI